VNAAVRFTAGIPAGVIADRYNRRQVLLLCDVVRAVAVALFAATVGLLSGPVAFAALLTAVALEGWFSVMFSPAERGLLRGIVADEELPQAFSRNESRGWFASIVGPPVRGAAYGLHPVLPFAGNAISYVVSFLFIRGIPVRFGEIAPPEPGSEAQQGWPAAWLAGFRQLWPSPFWRRALAQVCVHNLMLGALQIYVVVGARSAGLPGAVIGSFVGVQALGALAGSLVAARLAERLGPGRTMVATGLSWTTLVPLIVLTGATPWVLVPLAVLWALVPSQRVALNTYQARTTTGELHGRVTVAIAMVVGMLAPLGPLLGGAALEFGSPPIVATGAGVVLLTPLVPWLAPGAVRARFLSGG
jgi:MFS family permease